MIERIVTIKSYEWLDTKDGSSQYLSIVVATDEGKESKFSVFDPKLQKPLLQAEKAKLPLKLLLEKQGNFWNIKGAEVLDSVPEAKQAGADNSKDRSMSVSYAKDLVVAGKVELKDIFAMAKKIASYVETGEIE